MPADATNPEDRADYLERVERHFGLRRGGRLVLSPRDWQLVQEWHAAGIPAAVVMRGINRAFDRFDASGPRPDRINSLAYCKQHVLEAWEEHRELAAADAGPHDAGEATATAARHLRAAAERCREAARRRRDTSVAAALDEAAAALDELAAAGAAGELATRDIDAQAERIESTLRGRLPGAFTRTDHAAPELPRFSPWAV